MATLIDVLELIPGVFVVALLTAPIWLRVVNEVTTRALGKAVVICPHCGVPGIVESTQPKVIR